GVQGSPCHRRSPTPASGDHGSGRMLSSLTQAFLLGAAALGRFDLRPAGPLRFRNRRPVRRRNGLLLPARLPGGRSPFSRRPTPPLAACPGHLLDRRRGPPDPLVDDTQHPVTPLPKQSPQFLLQLFNVLLEVERPLEFFDRGKKWHRWSFNRRLNRLSRLQ